MEKGLLQNANHPVIAKKMPPDRRHFLWEGVLFSRKLRIATAPLGPRNDRNVHFATVPSPLLCPETRPGAGMKKSPGRRRFLRPGPLILLCLYFFTVRVAPLLMLV